MKRRNLLIIIGILIVVLVAVAVIFFINHISEKNNEPKGIISLETIENYNYVLEDRDTELYKSKFEALRDELAKDEIDYKLYAQLLAELYIIDLYTISNKINQYDIGGKEFVHPDAQENYELKVQDTLYKYLQDNTYDKREQKLPTVLSIDIDEIIEETQKLGEEEISGYTVKLSWEYVTDLGYDREAIVKLVQEEDKLFIISQSVSED